MPEKIKPLSEPDISFPPHIKDTQSIKIFMWCVVIALMPSNIYAIYTFGLKALALLLISVVSALAAESVFQLLAKKPVSVSDGSAVITGLLVAMNMPPDIPVYIVITGSFFAIIIVKQFFGGLGSNIFNPALSAKAFILLLWPAYFNPVITNNTRGIYKYLHETNTYFQGITGILYVTPISPEKTGDLLFSEVTIDTLMLGNISGCIGEISPILLLLGGLFLFYKKIITWHIPVSYIGTFTLFILLYYTFYGFFPPIKAMLFHLSSGSLILGALFMATDMVTSPVTAKGMIFFGIGCGIITFVIRLWTESPADVCFAILIMNAAVPLIDNFSKPKIFGT